MVALIRPPSSTLFTDNRIGFEGQSYFSDLPEDHALSRSSFVTARLKGLYRSREGIQFRWDLMASSFLRPNEDFWMVPELYAGVYTKNLEVSLGRKLVNWSEADTYWRNGLWQGVLSTDPLRAEVLGLTGLIAQYRTDQFRFAVLGSNLFIPSMGVNIREENGTLISNSRWYRRPASEVEFNGQTNRILYSLKVPEASELVQQRSFVAMAEYDLSNDVSIHYAGGVKPVNDLLITRNTYRELASPIVKAKVSPSVAQHEIHTVEAIMKQRGFRLVGSYTMETPKNVLPKSDWVSQRLSPSQVYSIHSELDLEHFFHRESSVNLGVMHVSGGEIVDVREDGTEDDFTMFRDRYRWKDLFRLGGRTFLHAWGGKELFVEGTWSFDNWQKGYLWTTEFQLVARQLWSCKLGINVLGVDADDRDHFGFLQQFKMNDRVYAVAEFLF